MNELFDKLPAVKVEKIQSIIEHNERLKVGYSLEGYLLAKIIPEYGIRVLGLRLNGNNVQKLFCTSKVKSIDGELITTENSVWKVTPIQDNFSTST